MQPEIFHTKSHFNHNSLVLSRPTSKSKYVLDDKSIIPNSIWLKRMITTMFFVLVPLLKRAPRVIIHLARNAEKGGGVLMSLILPNLKHSFISPILVPVPDPDSRFPGFPYALHKKFCRNVCAFQDRIGIWKCWFLRRGENWSTRRKTSQSRVENQQRTQLTYDAGSGNRTRAALVGGERHPSAIPALLHVQVYLTCVNSAELRHLK